MRYEILLKYGLKKNERMDRSSKAEEKKRKRDSPHRAI